MKLGLALLCLVALALVTQQARAESVRWIQPDYEAGDTFEYRIVSVEVALGWQPLEELWRVGEVRGAVVAPLVSVTVEARTWRGGVVSEVSEPVVYVPEPGGLLGLVVGIAALCVLANSPEARGAEGGLVLPYSVAIRSWFR